MYLGNVRSKFTTALIAMTKLAVDCPSPLVQSQVRVWTQASWYKQDSNPIKWKTITAESDLYYYVGFSVKITFFNEVISQQPNSTKSFQKHDTLLVILTHRFSEINGYFHIIKFNIIFILSYYILNFKKKFHQEKILLWKWHLKWKMHSKLKDIY